VDEGAGIAAVRRLDADEVRLGPCAAAADLCVRGVSWEPSVGSCQLMCQSPRCANHPRRGPRAAPQCAAGIWDMGYGRGYGITPWCTASAGSSRPCSAPGSM
jgi:hypothetical protein